MTEIWEVTIGENAIVAAGEVASKDIPANTVVSGVPSKIFKTIQYSLKMKKYEKDSSYSRFVHSTSWTILFSNKTKKRNRE
jgi:serine acetyltransferase